MIIDWVRPGEELPEDDRDVLFVSKSSGLLRGGYWNGRTFKAYDGLVMTEDEVSAWCYAPSLPEWCYEEE